MATPEPEPEAVVEVSEVEDVQAQTPEAPSQDAQAQDGGEQIVAFAPGIELPPGAAPTNGQPRDGLQPPSDLAPVPADEIVVLASDDDSFARDANPITIDANKIANLQSVLDALDRARVRTTDAPPAAGPRPLVGPGGMIDTTVSRVASAVAGPAASSTPARRPSATPTPGASTVARSNVAPAPRLPNAVPPALQLLRVRVGQSETEASKPPAETTTVRVRVAPEEPRLMGMYAGRNVSTDFLSLGLLAAGLAGAGVFGRATRDGRRRFWFGPRRA